MQITELKFAPRSGWLGVRQAAACHHTSGFTHPSVRVVVCSRDY